LGGDLLTGLDKIISEIMQESEQEVRGILDNANEEARQILESAKEKSEETVKNINALSMQRTSELEAGFKIALDTQNRRRILEKKQGLIAETLLKAKEMLYGLSDGEYFDLLLKLAVKSAQSGEGTLFLNARDKQRLPDDFEAKLNAALPRGTSLKLSGATVGIDGGLLLEYGDVVENCSIESIFNARFDEFSDIVRGVLFDERD
jgi:V/A-type H+-transporting ATPase subunit E